MRHFFVEMRRSVKRCDAICVCCFVWQGISKCASGSVNAPLPIGCAIIVYSSQCTVFWIELCKKYKTIEFLGWPAHVSGSSLKTRDWDNSWLIFDWAPSWRRSFSDPIERRIVMIHSRIMTPKSKKDNCSCHPSKKWGRTYWWFERDVSGVCLRFRCRYLS